MFIVGLVVGALVGVLLGDFLFHSRYFSTILGSLVLALLLIFFALVPIFSAEFRAGLVPAILLGALLVVTPMPARSDAPEAPQPL